MNAYKTQLGNPEVPLSWTMQGDAMDRLPARLENWKRWLRRHRRFGEEGFGQAESFEGCYRSKGSRVMHPPGPRPEAAREADAWDIEVATATLSIRLHLALKLKFVVNLEDHKVAEIFRREFRERTKTEDIQAIEWDAKVALLEALSAPLAIRRVRAVERARHIIAKVEDMMVD